MTPAEHQKVSQAIAVLDGFAANTEKNRQWHVQWQMAWQQASQGLAALVDKEQSIEQARDEP